MHVYILYVLYVYLIHTSMFSIHSPHCILYKTKAPHVYSVTACNSGASAGARRTSCQNPHGLCHPNLRNPNYTSIFEGQQIWPIIQSKQRSMGSRQISMFWGVNYTDLLIWINNVISGAILLIWMRSSYLNPWREFYETPPHLSKINLTSWVLKRSDWMLKIDVIFFAVPWH